MAQSHLKIRIPEKGELTLSMPEGVLRALREQRLPSFAEVWHEERQAWVSLAGHPAVLALLQSVSSHTTRGDERAPAVRIPAPVGEAAPVGVRRFLLSVPPSAPSAGESAEDIPALILPESSPLLPTAAELLGETAEPPDGADAVEAFVPVASAEPAVVPDPPPPVEATARLTAGDADEQSGLETGDAMVTPVPETTGEVTPDELAGPVPVPVAAPRFSAHRLRRGVRAGALMLLAGVLSIFGFEYVHARATRAGTAGSSIHDVAPRRVVPEPGPDTLVWAPERTPLDAAQPQPVPDLPLQGVSGSGPEPELETRLRLAGVGTWDPVGDFGSADAIVIARHKVDAMRNSIAAYRIDMERLSDSARGTPEYARQVEPYDETVKLDSALATVASAVQWLGALEGNFRVDGSALVFSRASDAERWHSLHRRADSILASPVELDHFPGTVRPPRRYITRLVATLPSGR